MATNLTEDDLPRITVVLNGTATNNAEGREVYPTRWTPPSRLQSTIGSVSKSLTKSNTPELSRRITSSKKLFTTPTKTLPSRILNNTSTLKRNNNDNQSSLKSNFKDKKNSLFSSSLVLNSKPIHKNLESIHDKKGLGLDSKILSHSRDRTREANVAVNLNFAVNVDSSEEDKTSNDVGNTSEPSTEKKLQVPLYKSSVQVSVRMRPFLKHEKDISSYKVMIRDKEVLVKNNDRRDRPLFKFDYVFDSSDIDKLDFVSQEKVFLKVGQEVLDYALQGYNTCLFAYGQSGSGKTYTMMGSKTNPGVIPRLMRELFSRIERSKDVEFRITINFLEIYQEKLYDLLADDFAAAAPHKHNLRVRECPTLGAHVPDLTNYTVEDFETAIELMHSGNKRRIKASTALNETSSRSHAVFSIIIVQNSSSGSETNLVSKINLVDLAGSERPSENERDRFREGAIINKSLFTLGKVIDALSKDEKIIPYRESQLTFLLKDSLGGNSLTFMMATISPAYEHMEETISTLRYASTASKIVNIVHVNEDPTTQYINTLLKQISVLKKQVKNSENPKLQKVSSNEEDVCVHETIPKSLWDDPSTGASSDSDDFSKNCDDSSIRETLFNLSEKIDTLFDYKNDLSKAFDELKNVVCESFRIEVPSFETKTLDLLRNMLNDFEAIDITEGMPDYEKILKTMEMTTDEEYENENVKFISKRKNHKKSKEKKTFYESDSESGENNDHSIEKLKNKNRVLFNKKEAKIKEESEREVTKIEEEEKSKNKSDSESVITSNIKQVSKKKKEEEKSRKENVEKQNVDKEKGGMGTADKRAEQKEKAAKEKEENEKKKEESEKEKKREEAAEKDEAEKAKKKEEEEKEKKKKKEEEKEREKERKEEEEKEKKKKKEDEEEEKENLEEEKDKKKTKGQTNIEMSPNLTAKQRKTCINKYGKKALESNEDDGDDKEDENEEIETKEKKEEEDGTNSKKDDDQCVDAVASDSDDPNSFKKDSHKKKKKKGKRRSR